MSTTNRNSSDGRLVNMVLGSEVSWLLLRSLGSEMADTTDSFCRLLFSKQYGGRG